MEDLESLQAKLESREETLIRQEDLYIASKEALALERNEVESLHKALAKEQEDHAITKKANNALKKKYCDLDEKHKELELQYDILWDSNPHPILNLLPQVTSLVVIQVITLVMKKLIT